MFEAAVKDTMKVIKSFIVYLVILCVIFVPLGIWKMVELIGCLLKAVK